MIINQTVSNNEIIKQRHAAENRRDSRMMAANEIIADARKVFKAEMETIQSMCTHPTEHAHGSSEYGDQHMQWTCTLCNAPIERPKDL